VFPLKSCLSAWKRAGVQNVVFITADVHYTAAHHYSPERAAYTDFTPFWEFVSGPLADSIGSVIGLGSQAVQAWNIAKWPVMALVFLLMIAVLYYASPNVKLRGFRWVTPGAIVAIVVWAIASALFALYVANFGSYDKTYGTLGGVVSFLVWLWLTNIAVLLGAELNAELERGAFAGEQQELPLQAPAAVSAPGRDSSSIHWPVSPSPRLNIRSHAQSSAMMVASATPANWNRSMYHDFSCCSYPPARNVAGCPTDSTAR